MRAQNKVKIKWSGDFAYGIGLITTDGNLSPDGRHITFTSKDIELAKKFQKSFSVVGKISKKANGTNPHLKKYNVIQIGDKNFYSFLMDIGLMPSKTKLLHKINVPNKYFFDFLRGHLDGDGTFYSYWDKRWPSSYMFYTSFCSASKVHIVWLRTKLQDLLGITGHISKAKRNSCYQLRYAKTESLVLLPKLYPKTPNLHLDRKYLKINKVLAIIGKPLNGR